MQFPNTPISVWHGQLFEVPVLEDNSRWAVVKYTSPMEKPRKWRPLSGWFVVRHGQSFSALGNVDCLSIRVWSFHRLISIPRKRRLHLTVRRLDRKPVPYVYTHTPELNIIKAVSRELHQSVLSATHLRLERILTPHQPKFNLVNFQLQLIPMNEEPELKNLNSPL